MPRSRKKAVFVSYNAVSEPLVRSQVLPYISALSNKGIKFYLLTFEKDSKGHSQVCAQLKKDDIDWIKLRFHSHPVVLAKTFDFVVGFFVLLYICSCKNIKIVHSRSIIPALMSMLPAKIARAYLIFDMKSSLAEAYKLSGKIKKGSFVYRTLSFLERACASNSDEVIVETQTHKISLEKIYPSARRIPKITVLPCCVETQRFSNHVLSLPVPFQTEIRLIYLGSLSGWYMFPQMFDFFKVFQKRFQQAEFLFLTDDKEGFLPNLAKEKNVNAVKVIKSSYKEVPQYLYNATAGILFKWPNERLDSFPIKVAEYLAAGLPIIINAGMGDVEKMVRESKIGVIVHSFDESGYESVLGELEDLINEGISLRKRCTNSAAEHLSSSFAFTKYEEIYRRATKDNIR